MGSIPTLPGERKKPGKSKGEEKLGEWGKTKEVEEKGERLDSTRTQEA